MQCAIVGWNPWENVNRRSKNLRAGVLKRAWDNLGNMFFSVAVTNIDRAIDLLMHRVWHYCGVADGEIEFSCIHQALDLGA
jgi:hypothetical protein